MPFPEETPAGTGTAGTYYFFDSFVAAEGRKYNGVLGGLGVQQSVTPSMTLRISSGQFHQRDMTEPNRTLASPTTVTLAAADPDKLRVDIISIYWNGSSVVTQATVGTFADNSMPIPNAQPPNSHPLGAFNVVLATVMVYPGVTAIGDENIYDRRFFLPFQYTGLTPYVVSAGALGGVVGNEIGIWNVNGSLEKGPVYTTLGDVKGPAVSIDNEVVLYSGTTGKLIKRSSDTGRPKLAAGVLSVGDINLAAEVFGRLPYVNLTAPGGLSRLLGRGAASGGDWQELTLGTGLSMTGTVLSASGALPAVSQQGLYNTDTAERNLLSFTVPGGSLGVDQGYLFFILGRYLFNSGTPTVTIRIKLGATTLMGDASTTLAANVANRTLMLWGMLTNVGATNVQRAIVSGYIGAITAGSVAGVMDIAVANTATFALITGNGTSAEDTTSDKVLSITNQFSVSNVAVECAWKSVAYLTG
jgi:hypothetical protein